MRQRTKGQATAMKRPSGEKVHRTHSGAPGGDPISDTSSSTSRSSYQDRQREDKKTKQGKRSVRAELEALKKKLQEVWEVT